MDSHFWGRIAFGRKASGEADFFRQFVTENKHQCEDAGDDSGSDRIDMGGN